MGERGRRRARATRLGAAAVPLALALAVTATLAWSAWDARAAHRRSAERTVRDYADFAAALVASDAGAAMSQTLLYAFYPADLAERGGVEGPVLPAELAANPPEAGRCAAAYPEGRWFARLGAGERELEWVGPLRPELAAWLAAALAPLLEGPGQGRGQARSGNLYPVVGGRREVVAWRVRTGPHGAPLEVHALAHCFEVRDETLAGFESAFARAARRSSLLPPSLVGDLPADSLLAVRVTDPAGAEVYRSPRAYTSRFGGLYRPAGGPLEGLEISVLLRPEVSDRLVAGGVPGSLLPLTVGLVLLAGSLLAATLLQVRRSLELARLRERFLADVSHELRTPLQQILIFVQLLRLGRLGSEEERAQSLGIVERETHRLIGLVERLLTFARPPRPGARREGGSATPLAEGVREALAAFRPAAEAAGTRLELHLEDGLKDETLRVALPAGSLRQVLVNVLDNALKYGPAGQRIRVAVERAGELARVTVDDEGPGIPPGERERVWRPFHRLEREAASATSGSGIGLALVREIVEEAGGRTSLAEAPGGGTRVGLELPLATAGGEAAPARAAR